MKHLLLFLGLIASSLCLHSQTTTATVISVSGEEVVLKNLITPTYPPLARVANISGSVELLVTLRADGTPQSVDVLSGHAMLKEAASDSASRSEYVCLACNGKIAQYRLTYVFSLIGEGDCCSAISVRPTVTQEPNRSSATAPQPSGMRIKVEAPKSCICDPAFTVRKRVRSLKCLYLWRCSTQ
ncbi:MAG: energy transducer TonB [Acidobacteriaceae bacterium]